MSCQSSTCANAGRSLPAFMDLTPKCIYIALHIAHSKHCAALANCFKVAVNVKKAVELLVNGRYWGAEGWEHGTLLSSAPVAM